MPTLINRVYGKSQFLDGRAQSLEQQALPPILNASEMNLTLPELVDEARQRPELRGWIVTTLEEVIDFYDAGGRSNPNIVPEIHPLQAFLKSLSGRPL